MGESLNIANFPLKEDYLCCTQGPFEIYEHSSDSSDPPRLSFSLAEDEQ